MAYSLEKIIVAPALRNKLNSKLKKAKSSYNKNKLKQAKKSFLECY
jgi:hypothetical protein